MNFFGILRVGVLTAMLLRNFLALISAPGLLSVPSKLAMPSKFSSRIPWREKLTRQQEPKIVAIPPRMQARFGKGKMVIPKPLDVDALIRRVPRGKDGNSAATARRIGQTPKALWSDFQPPD
jgi:hypothetical protein